MPTLALSMIVKNEAKNLSRCLDSVREFVDEIVIVDTGSTDETIKIAESFGATIIQIDWPGAFDVARNVGLDHVSSDWTLVLDGDEWLGDDAGSKLREVIERDCAGFYIIREDIDDVGGKSEMHMLRLWKSHPDVRFIGVIHEQISPVALRKAHSQPVEKTSEVRFLHDGYATKASHEKNLRDVQMLRRELELRPGSLYYESLLSAMLFQVGAPEAKSHHRRLMNAALARAEEPATPELELSLVFMRELESITAADFNTARTKSIMLLAWKWYSNYPAVVYAMKEFEIRRQSPNGVLQCLNRLVEMSETGVFSRHRSVHSEILGPGNYRELARLTKLMGDRDRSKWAWTRVAELVPGDEEALSELG